MTDTAREHLTAEIDRADATCKMLRHLAKVVEDQPQRSGETYRGDAMGALLHGAELAKESKRNLLHVAEVYDRKVAGD